MIAVGQSAHAPQPYHGLGQGEKRFIDDTSR